MKAYKLFLAILITLSLTANYVYADESSEVINHINNYYYGTFSENTNMSFKRDRYTSENLYLQNLVSSLDEYSQYYTKEELENSNLSYDKSIETTMYGKDIFNIKINDFREGTDKEFSEYLDKYLRIGAKTMILDLSDCQGGRMDIMANIAKKIVPKGLICTMIFKNSKFDYYSTLENEPCKMIVLVSQKTASAAEALVSALKCTHAATIAGEITYGKSANIYNIQWRCFKTDRG